MDIKKEISSQLNSYVLAQSENDGFVLIGQPPNGYPETLLFKLRSLFIGVETIESIYLAHIIKLKNFEPTAILMEPERSIILVHLNSNNDSPEMFKANDDFFKDIPGYDELRVCSGKEPDGYFKEYLDTKNLFPLYSRKKTSSDFIIYIFAFIIILIVGLLAMKASNV